MLIRQLLLAASGILLAGASLTAQRLSTVPPVMYPATQVTPAMQATKNATLPAGPAAFVTGTVPSCQDLQPICTAPNVFYTLTTSENAGAASTTNPTNNYGCLATTPNPIWYYMQIDQPGDLILNLNAQRDIDFAVWGPFASKAAAEAACGTYGIPHNCSYSATNSETITITGAQNSEIYVLLITNFSNITQPATLTQIGGNASMGCSQFSSMNGTVFNDANTNCVGDASEIRMPNMILQSTWGFANTNANGDYHIFADSGAHTVHQVIPSYLQALLNPICAVSYTQQFTYTPTNVFGLDFFNDVLECPYLTVDITSNRRRRCFQNFTVVEYCNEGFADAQNAQVFVEFPQYVNFVSADMPYTIDSNGVYVFNVGTLTAGQCGTINIVDSVSCINGITGTVQCMRAWITPPNSCVEAQDTVNPNDPWDRSSVMVNGSCVNDSIARFVIHNNGSSSNGNMAGVSEYRIYIDGLLVYTGTFQIAGGADFIVEVPATGGVIRLEADQRPNHPGNSHPNDVVQGCGNSGNANAQADWLAYNAQPSDDADVTIEEDCMPIRDSYDPNDKQVSPGGAGPTHAVLPNTLLDYTIRFQNTGNDYAYRVIIRDTLSAHFDIATLQLDAHSHDYDFYLTGTDQQPILVFDHRNINLDYSSNNDLASQGFVSFKIAPKSSTPLGTQIDNNAAIFFDFNEPIYTNTAWITLSNPVHGNPIQVNVVTGVEQTAATTPITVYPNPAQHSLNVDLGRVAESASLRLLGIDGKIVAQQELANQQLSQLDLSNLPSGIYMLHVVSGQQYSVVKVVKH